VLGNLTVFFGPDMFNAYAHELRYGALGAGIKVVEFYLAAAFGLHMVSSGYLTLKYNKLAPSKKQKSWLEYPTGNAKLALTGIFISVFLVLHIFHFRWVVTESMDMHARVVEVLSDQKMLLFYVVATAVIGGHLSTGWIKTVNKLDFSGSSKELKKPVTDMGTLLIRVIIAGFIAVAVKFHLVK